MLNLSRARAGRRRRDHALELAGADRQRLPRPRPRHRVRRLRRGARRRGRDRPARRRRPDLGHRLALDLLRQRADRRSSASLLTADPRRRVARPDRRAGIDWIGLVTFSSSLFLLVYALTQGNNNGWGSAEIVGCLAGAVALMAAFARRRDAPARTRCSTSRCCACPPSPGAAIVGFALSASIFSLYLYLTLYIQNVLGFGPLAAGAALPADDGAACSSFSPISGGRPCACRCG